MKNNIVHKTLVSNSIFDFLLRVSPAELLCWMLLGCVSLFWAPWGRIFIHVQPFYEQAVSNEHP